MRRSQWFARAGALVLGLTVTAQLWAFPEFARETESACIACHKNPAGGATLTESGTSYKAEKKAPAAVSAKAAEYVGVNRCKTCHAKQYKGRSDTPHARSMSGLHAADPTVGAEMAKKLNIELKDKPSATEGCVKCHVTGFKLAGGYPAADSTKNAALAAVACESCHGPGSLHVAAPMAQKKNLINRTVTENVCKQCHTTETSPRFNFSEYRTRGVHPIATRAGAGR